MWRLWGTPLEMTARTLSSTGGTNIRGGRYIYTEELLALEALSRVGGTEDMPNPVTNPLPLDKWSMYLSLHLDEAFAAFLRRGMSGGFWIGFSHNSPLRPAPKKFRSVDLNPSTVNKYVAEEMALGRLVVFHTKAGIRRNPIGIIPKPHQPGKYRLIVDLSALPAFSMNDGIPVGLSSLDYVSVDQAARLVMKCGRGALIAKCDLQSDYRQVPIHPEDQELLGFEGPFTLALNGCALNSHWIRMLFDAHWMRIACVHISNFANSFS